MEAEMFFSKHIVKKAMLFLLIWGAVFFNISFAIAQENDDSIKSANEIEGFFLKTRVPTKETKLVDLVLPLEVNFELNSHELAGDARKQLDNLATVLLKPHNKKLKLEIAGHTCNLGGEELNLNLSRKRIASAFEYLEENYGIDESRLSTIAYGESLPVIANAISDKERAINRRVVVYLPDNRIIIENILKKNLEKPGFQWAVINYTAGNTANLVKYDGSSVLQSTDQYRIYLRPQVTKYVYIYQQDSHGNREWLFPREDSYFSNPVSPGEYYLPHRSKVFVLDDNLGIETISILAADKAIYELDSFIAGESSQELENVITRVIKTRGLKVTRVAPPPKGTNTQEGNILISGHEPGEKVNDPVALQNNISDLITEYGEFYMEIKFDHQ